MAVLVLDKHHKPLMACSEKRTRLLLERERAVVHRMAPLAIRLKDRHVEHSMLQPVRLKLDPGSQTTGMALVREMAMIDVDTGGVVRSAAVLMLLNLTHRGGACAYCGTKNVLLEIEPLHPKAHGGRNRVSNLALTGHACNQRQGAQTLTAFLAHGPDRVQRSLAQALRTGADSRDLPLLLHPIQRADG